MFLTLDYCIRYDVDGGGSSRDYILDFRVVVVLIRAELRPHLNVRPPILYFMVVKAFLSSTALLEGTPTRLGPYHPSTLQTIDNMRTVYFKLDKLTEAESMYERALGGKERVLGQKHRLTVETVSTLKNLHMRQGKLIEAEQMYE